MSVENAPYTVTDAAPIWASIAPKTDAEFARLAKAMNTADGQLADLKGQTLTIEHVIVQRIQLADPNTGELAPAARVVLVTPDGGTYSCVSEGVRGSLESWAGLGLVAPFSPPVVVTVREGRTGKGRKVLLLDYVKRAEPSRPGK